MPEPLRGTTRRPPFSKAEVVIRPVFLKGKSVMFRTKLIVSASIMAMSSLVACTINTANQPSESAGGRSNASTANKGVGGADATDWSSGGADDEESTGGTSNTFTYATGGKLGTGGTASVSCVLGGEVTASTTWEPNAACPDGYSVNRTVAVSGAGTKLTIKPGTKLKFASGTKLEVQASASLVAVGATENPIVFTGWQKLAGAWGGIISRSSALDNEISNAIIEYGGEKDNTTGAVVLSYDVQYCRLKLSNTQIRESAQFGMTVYEGATLAQFDNNTITKNSKGAIRVEVPSVHQLRGTGNSIVDNGEGNTVFIEASASSGIKDVDVSWPNLSPAVYRVGSTSSTVTPQIWVERHLTIDPGTVMEFVGGAGIFVDGGAAGLSAVGTATAPITFRGVNGSGWAGIGIYACAWSGNALEEVHIENAAGPLFNSGIYFNDTNLRAAIGVSQIMDSDAARLRVKNLTVSGPNNASVDIEVASPAVLTQEGTNKGSGPAGELVVK